MRDPLDDFDDALIKDSLGGHDVARKLIDPLDDLHNPLLVQPNRYSDNGEQSEKRSNSLMALIVIGSLIVISLTVVGVTYIVTNTAVVASNNLLEVLKGETSTTLLKSESLGTGSRHELVVATYSGVDTFARSNRWPGDISTIGVEATVQFDFNYFISLDSHSWQIDARRQGDHISLNVKAPQLQITREKISTPSIKFRTTDGSWFQSAEALRNKMLEALYPENLEPKAKALMKDAGVREQARIAVKKFVKSWVAEKYPAGNAANRIDADSITVRFEDEPTS